MGFRIKFKQTSAVHVDIIAIQDDGTEKDIGHIFTPSGSSNDNLNAIQVCGFDEAFDLWGCGVYGDKSTGQMKKDIQLCWHSAYDAMSDDEMRDVVVEEKEHHLTTKQMKKLGLKSSVWVEKIKKSRFGLEKDSVCGKCFNHPCTCEIATRYENPYTVKREQDLQLDKRRDN